MCWNQYLGPEGLASPRTFGRQIVRACARHMKTPFYRFKVTLCDLEPKVWRRIEVPATTELVQLHRIIQIAMGWENTDPF